ncbi:hypothetical protein Q5762_13900 [Streptomyces sp. P9(2023)]|uniref:hypothetical protein n=1 Tax=Streptomyces sp. P9(2023) TaxID=3064394 RepID=UPI0028F453CF|nr:hypothetical protein [Streptomyces sp. P9(2023)]MDT9689410.1 hypothetical protein [Streptomyces sp. P9(2023)]
MSSFRPLFDAEQDTTGWTPPLDIARSAGRQALERHEAANIHDHTEMLRAAVALEMALRQVLDALDAEEGR